MSKILDFNQKKQENIINNKDDFDDLLDFIDSDGNNVPENITLLKLDTPAFIEGEDRTSNSDDFITNLLKSDIDKAGYAKYLLGWEFTEYVNFTTYYFENKPCKVINHALLEELLISKYRKEDDLKNLSSNTIKEILECHKNDMY